MINRNIAEKATLYSLLAAAAVTATANGSSVDVRAARGSMAFLLSTAAASSGDTLDVKIQDSADGATGWADVTGGAFTQVTSGAASQQKLALNADALRGYVRAVVTVGGDGSPSIIATVVALGWTA